MQQQIYVNLPVKALDRSKRFFASLGFKFKEEFGNGSAACLVVSDTIFVVLLAEPFFATFTSKPIADAHSTTETLLCLTCESRDDIDELVRLAVAAGGCARRAPLKDSFGYSHGFEDLDGHIWTLICMQSQQNNVL
ncbi:MAG: VOC family protein [Dokdonella sp.]